MKTAQSLPSDVERANKEGILRYDQLSDLEDTLALRLAATTMHKAEAAVYAMAYVRGGICCSTDMSGLRQKCAENGVPLLGVFGILHHAFCQGLLTDSEADAAISAMLAKRVQIPRVCFADVRNWFEQNSGIQPHG